MKKLCVFLVFLVLIGTNYVQAQTFRVSGTVTSSQDGLTIPGVSVLVKGTTVGITTDLDGKYALNVPAGSTTLVFSFVGMKTQEVEINGRAIIDVILDSESLKVEELVVTALGITRSKKSLGYATQEVKGDEMTTVKSINFMNGLSGKVTGVQIKKNNNMGGSTNVVIRGSKSLNGNNQVLYVVDGVPINNAINNAMGQDEGDGGYDYGNAAADINPDDIESLNVLKGSAATALYGSRAAAGVIMITTKKGAANKKGIGVTINSNVQFTSIDKSTFPEYQKKYGAGYGPYYGPNDDGYFNIKMVDGVAQEWIPTTEDASYGAKYDPNKMVYGWYSVDPESPWYNKAMPWVYPKNDPITFFEKPVTYSNSIAIDNSTEKVTYRLSYSNNKTSGLLPNSNLQKDNFMVNGSWKVTDKLTATASANFSRQTALGRNSTGYDDNILSNMRQWAQLNVDYKMQKQAYMSTKRNLTWNYNSKLNYPIFTDNPYFQRYQNYENDERNRTIGNMSLNYKVTSWLDVFVRTSVDSYTDMQEERRAVGSVATAFGVSGANQKSGYMRRDITFNEYNYDFMLNFNKELNESFNIKGVIGANERRNTRTYLASSTNGGLNVPGIYSLQNSVDALPLPDESLEKVGVRGFYASVSLGYKGFLFLDGTYRRDYSSTLPKGNNKFSYPSIAGSFIFTDLVNQSWLSFGKIRLNYAEVGASTVFDNLIDTYTVNTPLNKPIYTLPIDKKQSLLKPENTKSIEAGLEMKFMKNRLGVDLALYKTNSFNQIMNAALSNTTGYDSKWVNAGELENKGIELALNATPVEVGGFKWDISVNWAKNYNKVVKLYPGITNYQIADFQGGVTLNATEGEPYGVLKGTDYTYYNGKKIIDPETGCPVKSTSSAENIGNINPDWNGGIHNTISYKGVSLSFLIDMQKGGDIFSLDMYYGMNTGIYKETAGINDLGNEVRNPLVGTPGNYGPTSGGYIIDGVNVNEATGEVTPNQTRVDASNSTYGFGNAVEPNKAFIYDASYIKLREVSISYELPQAWLKKTFIKNATISAVGSNLWIIHKNLPYADPESGLSAGNVQGFSVGSLPTMREFGFNLKLNF